MYIYIIVYICIYIYIYISCIYIIKRALNSHTHTWEGLPKFRHLNAFFTMQLASPRCVIQQQTPRRNHAGQAFGTLLACVFVCRCVCVYVSMYLCIYVCRYACMHACKYALCMNVCECMHVSKHVYIIRLQCVCVCISSAQVYHLFKLLFCIVMT